MRRRDVLKAGLAAAGAGLLPASVKARERIPTALVLASEGFGRVPPYFPERVLRSMILPDVRVIDDPDEALDLAARRLSLVVVDPAQIAFPAEAGKALAWKRQLRALDPEVPLLFVHGYARGAYPAELFEGARELQTPFSIRQLVAECRSFGLQPAPECYLASSKIEKADHGNS